MTTTNARASHDDDPKPSKDAPDQKPTDSDDLRKLHQKIESEAGGAPKP